MRGLHRGGARIGRAGIALVLVMLAACGGGGDDPGASASEPDAQTSAPTAAPSEDTSTETADADEFCAEVEGIRDRLENLENLPDVADPDAAADTLQESVDALRSVDPPAEIAEDWSTVTDAFDGVVTGLRELDPSDPEALAQQIEDLVDQMEQEASAIDESGSRIDQYMSDECGITFG